MGKTVEEKVKINCKNGLHVRVAAMIVQKADYLQKEYKVTFYIRREGMNNVPLTSILLVTALKIRQDEEIFLVTVGEGAGEAAAEMRKLLESDFSMSPVELGQVDSILQDNAITAENIYSNIETGLVVADSRYTVIIYNRQAEKIFGIPQKEVLGKKVTEVFPQSKLPEVLDTGKPVLGYARTVGEVNIVINTTPILESHEVKGAISSILDVSKLMQVAYTFANRQAMEGISVVKSLSEIQELMDKISRLSAKTEYLEEELNRRQKLNPAFNRMVGVSSKLYDAMKMAAKTAENNFNVLIRGESGTGKELVAEAIHYSSERKDKPFIRVNCAAIPENLLESEMFGHVRGAYTGAIKTKIGKFELADKGTIFLDEIGELDKAMQAKMLRVIQKKEFQRVGDERTIRVDARIIAATNRNLEELVEKGEFREDLYYRLNVIPIWLPPLRERKEDIPLLCEHFLGKIAEELKCQAKKITPQGMEALVNYSWPGNIRELENVMERVNILSEGQMIQKMDLPGYISEHTSGKVFTGELVQEEEIMPWEYYEREIIRKALKKYKSFNRAAKALGLTHKTVAAKARKYHLEE